MIPIVRSTRWAGAFLALVVAVSMSWGAAHAGPLSTSTLIALKVVEQSARETRLEARFQPRANLHAAAIDDAGAPVVAFSVTARGPGLAIPQGLDGLVRSIKVEENPTVLFLRFDTGGPGATVSARPTSDDTVLVTVSRAAAPSPASPAEASAQEARPAEPAEPPGSLADLGYEMVLLKYADVSEVVGLLADGVVVKPNDSFTPRSPGFGSASQSGGAVYNPLPAPAAPDGQALGQSVSRNLAIDRRLNAIWVRGDRQTIDRIKAQIAAIDMAVDSVMLETQLVELTEAGARSIGIDFANTNGQIATATLTSGQYTSGGYGYYNQGGGSFLKSASLQAALYAQIAVGEGRILSRPRVLAQSGASANIVTGDAIPILTSITLSGVNGVSQRCST